MARNIEPDTRSKSLTREPSGLTLLQGRRPSTKTLGISADGILKVTQKHLPQTVFTYSHADVPDIWKLFEVLKEVSQDPYTSIIRAALRDHVNANGKVFRRKDIKNWGDDAHFEECPRCWGMIDFDDVPLDGIDLIDDPEGTVKRAIQKFLPECYQNVSFVWQLSSSAGIGADNGLLRVHIWFIYDRPVGHDELKTYHALKAPEVDRAVFRTVQVHYIAAPIFAGGITDHLPKRIGLVELDEDMVSLPVLPQEVVAAAHRSIGQGPTGSVHGIENKLKLIGDGDGLGGFHLVLIAAVSSYVYGKYECEIDIGWLKARLRRAINEAPKRAGRDVSNYLSDSYLDQNISSAVSKFCQVVTTPLYPAPTLTPKQARDEIKFRLQEAVDQHFEALAEWEKENKPFHDLFDAHIEKLKMAAKIAGEPVDLSEFQRLAYVECRAAGLERPSEVPKAVLNLAVGVGLGKTEQAFKVIKHVRDRAQTLLKADEVADRSQKVSRPTRIAYKRLTRAVLAVPTHKLADEAVTRAQSAGLSAGPFRGRLYKIKDTGKYPMCERPDEVRLCVEAGLPVASSMCKSGGAECQYRQICGYYGQIEVLKKCDVVVIPHASLFHEKPPINSRGLLIIDEHFAFDGERPRRAQLLSELRQKNDWVYSKSNGGNLTVDASKTASLHRYRKIAADAIVASPDGNLSWRAMRELMQSDVADAIRLEWQTVRHSPVYPGMDRKQLRKALASAASIKRMRLRVDFWTALLALISSRRIRKSGWLVRDTDGAGRVVVHVGGRASIKDGWFDGLAVCLDATSSRSLVQLFFPDHKVAAAPAIEAIQNNVTVLQTIDKSFSASMCIPEDNLDEVELQRRKNRAREVYRFILLRASEFRGRGAGGIDVLVICQKALEEHLIELGLPDSVAITHFNAIRGMDRWGDVRCLITIGRTLPSPGTLEVLAENLTGWAVEQLPDGSWYPRQSAGIDVGGGIGLPVQTERHPDPIVEAVRWQTCEAEQVQSAGRGRGVNRQGGNPLHLDVLSNVCLPMTVDQPIRWDDNAPGRAEEMVGIGLLPDGPAAAALIYPELWPTVKTAKMAASSVRAKSPRTNVLDKFSSRELKGLSSLLNIYSRDLSPFSRQPTDIPLLGSIDDLAKFWGIGSLAFGAMSRMEFAHAMVERPNQRALKFKFMFDSTLIPDPEGWLSERTGLPVEAEIIAPKQHVITKSPTEDPTTQCNAPSAP